MEELKKRVQHLEINQTRLALQLQELSKACADFSQIVKIILKERDTL